METRNETFSKGIKLILEINLLGSPKIGRVVEVHDDRDRLRSSNIALKAADEFNKAAITAEYWSGDC